MTGEMALGLILAHLVGDYLLQSHYMATQKTERWWPAIAHGATYTLPFLLLTQSPLALLVIGGTHVLIDHYRWAKQLGYLKNLLAPRRYRVSYAEAMANSGYPKDTPAWLATWLMVIGDNLVHMLINVAAVVWL